MVWFDGVDKVGDDGCQEYGFFFSKLALNGRGFVAANILFHFFFGDVLRRSLGNFRCKKVGVQRKEESPQDRVCKVACYFRSRL